MLFRSSRTQPSSVGSFRIRAKSRFLHRLQVGSPSWDAMLGWLQIKNNLLQRRTCLGPFRLSEELEAGICFFEVCTAWIIEEPLAVIPGNSNNVPLRAGAQHGKSMSKKTGHHMMPTGRDFFWCFRASFDSWHALIRVLDPWTTRKGLLGDNNSGNGNSPIKASDSVCGRRSFVPK